jgi:serine/threonine-protein kinase
MSLQHPNVVRAIDSGVAEDGSLFLAMELLRGESLGTRIARSPLPPVEVARIGRDAAAGLGAAHALGSTATSSRPTCSCVPTA